ncbi:site-specific integrase [Hamadaea sp. NPDC050747]|uniref:site-specific integrase n=1 Tax=Hamadaea sp. NPDC050747 TaxID=3155789 RepID=UPI003409912B
MKTLLDTPGHDDKNLFKRCGCVNPATGRRSGSLCPQLTDPGHGAWYFAVKLPTQRGRRQRLRRGGYATCAEARTARDQVLDQPSGLAAGKVWTLERWPRQWLVDISDVLRPTTVNSYAQHVRLYLVPNLGHFVLADLTTRQVQSALRSCQDDSAPMASSSRPRLYGGLSQRCGPPSAQPFATDSSPATSPPRHDHHVPARAMPCSGPNDANATGASTVSGPPSPSGTSATSPSSSRTPSKTRTFALWWVALLCGLRRGELAGLRWCDIDVEDKTLTVARQTICIAGRIHRQPPKSVTSKRTVTLDDGTIAVLQKHRDLQDQKSFAWRHDSEGRVFTTIAGRPMRPSTMSHQFLKAVRTSGLPPVRLHDLRHGAATLAFAAQADLKYVQERLGHSSPVTTAKIYISVLSDIDNRQAQATARMILDAAQRRPEAGSSQA